MAQTALIASVTSDVDLGSSAGALADITGLSMFCTVGVTVHFDITLHYDSGNNVGARFGLNTPAGTLRIAEIGPTSTTAFSVTSIGSSNTVIIAETAGDTTDKTAIISGTFIPTANGTLQVRGCNEGSGAMSVLAGSHAIFWTDAFLSTETISPQLTDTGVVVSTDMLVEGMSVVVVEVATQINVLVGPTDAAALTLVEAVVALAVQVTGSDTGAVALVESGAIDTGAPAVVASDSAALTLIDAAGGVAVTLAASDPLALQLVDALLALAVTLAASDAVSPQVVDAPALDVTLSASDTVAVTASEAAALAVTLAASDLINPVALDALGALSAMLAAADAAPVTLLDLATAALGVLATDGVSVQVEAETGTVFTALIFLTAADVLPVVLVDTGALTDIEPVDVAAVESLAVGLLDLSTVALGLVASDTAAVQLDPEVGVQFSAFTFVTAVDAVTPALLEAAALAISEVITAVDDAGLTLEEVGDVFPSLAAKAAADLLAAVLEDGGVPRAPAEAVDELAVDLLDLGAAEEFLQLMTVRGDDYISSILDDLGVRANTATNFLADDIGDTTARYVTGARTLDLKHGY